MQVLASGYNRHAFLPADYYHTPLVVPRSAEQQGSRIQHQARYRRKRITLLLLLRAV
jgi:hypothetical protein